MIHFTTKLQPFFDLARSSTQSLVRKQEGLVTALLEPAVSTLQIEPGKTVELEVKITNKSAEAFPSGENVFGLSYHVLSNSGNMILFDNPRTYVRTALQPECSLTTKLPIKVPHLPGEYLVELDLVWEGMLWFKENGNPTAKIDLQVGLNEIVKPCDQPDAQLASQAD